MSNPEFEADEPFEAAEPLEGAELEGAELEGAEPLEAAEPFEEDGEEQFDDGGLDDSPPAPETPVVVEKQLLNVYTVMLLISLTALGIGIVSLWLQLGKLGVNVF